MKKFLILICMLFMLPVFADTMPFFFFFIPKNTIGLFQTGENLTIYSQPESDSKKIKEFNFTYNQEKMHLYKT